MRTRLAFGLLAYTLGASAMLAQPPTFEVASIKRNVSSSPNSGVGSQPGGRVNVVNLTLRNIVRGSQRLQDYQVVGGPDWITVDRWDDRKY